MTSSLFLNLQQNITLYHNLVVCGKSTLDCYNIMTDCSLKIKGQFILRCQATVVLTTV